MISSRQLVEQAEAEIETLSVEQARALLDDPGVTLVDVRDVRELWREGKIPGAVHAPRGMLEFWIDPESPYHRELFATGKRFVFYCSKGWRSALATRSAQQMGLEPVAHIGGGFTAWLAAGAPVDKVERK
jgi:rhodanese-related sulfurtransferase